MDNEKDLSAEKHNLLIEEMRQSFFQLENLTTALDNKAYGMIAFNTILLSIFGYIIVNYLNYGLMYIAPVLLVGSLITLLFCVYLREWGRPIADRTFDLFDNLDVKAISKQLAINYLSCEAALLEKYINKVKYLKISFIFTVLAIIIELVAISWLVINSL